MSSPTKHARPCLAGHALNPLADLLPLDTSDPRPIQNQNVKFKNPSGPSIDESKNPPSANSPIENQNSKIKNDHSPFHPYTHPIGCLISFGIFSRSWFIAPLQPFYPLSFIIYPFP
jgi:hypothetical protein